MTQYIIDTGAVPDDGQGDPLRTAFTYTNENFSQIFAAGPVGSNVQIGNTTITTTILNSNLILSPSGIGRIQLNNTLFPRINDVYDLGTPSLRFNSIYLGTGGIDATGGIATTGNITAGYFIGNGSQLTGIVASTGSEVVNGNSNINIPDSGSNIYVTVNGTGNVVTFANSGVYVAGEVSATGNVAGNYFIGNGALLTGINIGYSNANVANFLPTYTGNLVSLTGPVVTTANVVAGNLLTSGAISATGNITGGNINTGRLNAGYITTGTTISALGNITTNSYFIGDGSLLTGLNLNYSNANVAAFLPTYTGNLASLTGPVVTTANITGGNLLTSGLISAAGLITGGNVRTGNITAGNVVTPGSVSATGNVITTGYFIGDGSQLTNLPIGNYSNANVAAFLPTYTGNLSSLTGPVTTTANITGGNILTGGLISAAGFITGGNVNTNRLNAANVTSSGSISAVGNVSGNNLIGATVTVTTVSALGNITGGNIQTTGQISAVGNIRGGNLSAPGGTVDAYIVSATGRIQGNSFVTTGIITATGNITGGNVTTGNLQAANVNADANISAAGNVTAKNFLGNVISVGLISTTGNVAGNYFIGNGALLTGITVNAGTSLTNGNSNVVVSANANVDIGVRGVGNVATFANTGAYITGEASVTGNVSGNYFIGNGSQLTGVVATAIGTLGNLSVTGNIATGGILSDNYYYANGQPVPAGITYTANTSPPPFPNIADQWWDTDNDVLYEFISDGVSTYWVDTTSPAFASGIIANVAITGSLLPIANVTYDIGSPGSYFNRGFFQTVTVGGNTSVAGNVIAGKVVSDLVVASVLANASAINLQTNGTNALSIDSSQNITTARRLPAASMPAGAVVQTVMSSAVGGSITNSTSYVDISSASVTITPSNSTSKIVVIATGTSAFSAVSGTNINADTQLIRSPTTSLQTQNIGGLFGAFGGVGLSGTVAYSYTDSPATTSPITYKLQQRVSNSASTLTSSNIWLIAMEITA